MEEVMYVYDPWCPSSDASGYKLADCCKDCEERTGESCNAQNCHYRDGEMDDNYPRGN